MLAHPCLSVNQHLIEVAKHNIAQHDWAAQIHHELKLDADKLAEMELPKFETAWWQEAKKKHWRETYPEFYHHTFRVPRPAILLAEKSALVHLLGGGEGYADRAKRVLLYYTSYSFEFESPDVGMNWAIWGIRALRAYDMVYDRFTPAEREKLDDFFDRMIGAIARNDEWWIEHNPGGKFNNHFAWHKLMMAGYGLFHGKQEWIDRAMESDQGIRELIEHGFLDDGLWFESSLKYHFAALAGLVIAADMFRTAGYPLDLYTHRFANGRTLEQGFSGMVQAVFPDTTIPPIGDCYGSPARLVDRPEYEYAWIAYRKPLYAWLVSHNPKPSIISLFQSEEPGSMWEASPDGDLDAGQPPVESRVFPEHGHVILRSIEGKDYWNSDSWAAFLSYDLDSVHSHRDKMDFVLFGRGKLLAPDCEARASAAHAFSSQVQRELNRSTICHNTLMVDGKNHGGIREKLSLLEFKRLPDVKTATIADLQGLVYPGVKLQRTIAVTDDYVLDVFQAASGSEHTYDWLFHAKDDEGKTLLGGGDGEILLRQGDSAEASALAKAAADKSSPKGYSGQAGGWGDPSASIAWRELPWSWLRNPRSKVIDGTWQAEWHQGDVRLRLTMLGVEGTQVTLCDFPRNDKFEPPPIPMLIVRRTSKSAMFIALYQAEKADLPPVDISASEDRHGRLRIRVTVGGTASEHLVRVLR